MKDSRLPPNTAIYHTPGNEQIAYLAGIKKGIELAEELVKILQGIIEIGKRDMSNPKYDSYFIEAKLQLKVWEETCSHLKKMI